MKYDITDSDMKLIIQALFVAGNSGQMDKNEVHRIQENLKAAMPLQTKTDQPCHEACQG